VSGVMDQKDVNQTFHSELIVRQKAEIICKGERS